jgi:hypothetical protein
MAHHRDAALDQKCDRLGHPRPALELDRAAMGFLQNSHGRMEGLLLGGLVGAERHINDDERVLRAAHHRMALQDHHVECHGHGGFKSVHDVAEGVADQDDVTITIHERCGMGVVGGQHHDRLAILARANIGCGFTLDRRLN